MDARPAPEQAEPETLPQSPQAAGEDPPPGAALPAMAEGKQPPAEAEEKMRLALPAWASRLSALFGPKRKQRALVELCQTLLSEKGDALGAMLAAATLETFRGLDAQARLHFYLALAQPPFAPDAQAILEAAQRFADAPSADSRSQLVGLVDGPRQRLFRRLNFAPGATGEMIRMRSEMLDARSGHPQLHSVERDLWRLFSSWFNRGFLRLMRIDWNTRASVLEKLIAYEAVHEIKGWEDLKSRMAEDRRCFGFFHRNLKSEPLIFVEVALTESIPAEIAPLIDPERSPLPVRKAQCAVFYSISNCQQGLQGVSFGNLLIKQVVRMLREEFPHLKTFVTLSPMPGFCAWLRRLPEQQGPDLPRALGQVLDALQQTHWQADLSAREALRAPLSALAAWYLLHARRRESLVDPVARFHLGNGARVERINWLADLSTKGLAQSAGLMVNYLYHMDDVEKNHEGFLNHGQVASSRQVRTLATHAPPL